MDKRQVRQVNEIRASKQVETFVRNNGFPIIALGIQYDTKKLLMVLFNPVSKQELIERLSDYLEDVKTGPDW